MGYKTHQKLDMLFGYAGTTLRVDLSRRTIIKQSLDESLTTRFLGGVCLASKILYNEVASRIDPLDPRNILIFSTGPLNATCVPLASKVSVVTKSPLTSTLLACTMGGDFASELKYAGYDALLIQGRSDRQVYLWVNNGQVEIKDANDLKGLTLSSTEQTIKKDLGCRDVKIAAIGPAGENLVKFANITHSLYRHAGRGGAGAVMGSKNLKAIAIRGTRSIEVADFENLLKATEEILEPIAEGTISSAKTYTDYGTPSLVDPMNEIGIFPVRNFQSGVFQGVERINGGSLKRTMWVGNKACFGCPIACGKSTAVMDGDHKGTFLVGPEYETIYALGSNCGIDDLRAIAKANLLCDELGLDTISTGGVIGFAMECYEKGIITKDDTEFELRFGDEHALIWAIEKIAKREGIGDTLAEGVKQVSERLGSGAEKFAMHVKGLEMPGYDPRGAFGMGLAYAVSERGACHLRAYTISDEVFGTMDRFSIEGKAELVRVREQRTGIINSLVICDMMGLRPIYSSILKYVTGYNVKVIMSKEYPRLIEDFELCHNGAKSRIGETSTNIARAFNVREGFSRKDDRLPSRILEEPLPEGHSAGRRLKVEDLDRMLEEYYSLRGWDNEGRPTMSKLKELGIEST